MCLRETEDVCRVDNLHVNCAPCAQAVHCKGGGEDGGLGEEGRALRGWATFPARRQLSNQIGLLSRVWVGPELSPQELASRPPS